jgi:hypothetical protein
MVVYGSRPRWAARRHRRIERRRPARSAHVLARIAEHPAERIDETAAVEVLATAKSGGLTIGAIAHVFTISYVAKLHGEDEDWLFELSTNMFPEDGRLWVYGVGEDGVPALTKDGIENLLQIIADERAAGRGPPSGKAPG